MIDPKDQERIDEPTFDEAVNITELRAAILAGFESGPAEPLDMEAIIREARMAHERKSRVVTKWP